MKDEGEDLSSSDRFEKRQSTSWQLRDTGLHPTGTLRREEDLRQHHGCSSLGDPAPAKPSTYEYSVRVRAIRTFNHHSLMDHRSITLPIAAVISRSDRQRLAMIRPNELQCLGKSVYGPILER